MTAPAPVVSVIMPVHNGERFLREALVSVLAQTLRNLEVIIVDDGSTDGTPAILDSFTDPRIVRYRNATTLGLPASLNIGIRMARGEYIARMDADDVCEPQRLAKQAAYLIAHLDIGIVGSFATMIHDDSSVIGLYRRPVTHLTMKWKALASNPLIHPTVMARAEVLRAHPYDETYRNAQDYELWSRLLWGTAVRFANIPEPLLRYRIHGDPTAKSRAIDKEERSFDIVISNVERYGFVPARIRDTLSGLRMTRTITPSDACAFLLYRIRLAVRFVGRERPSFRERVSIVIDVARSVFNLLRPLFRGVRFGAVRSRA